MYYLYIKECNIMLKNINKTIYSIISLFLLLSFMIINIYAEDDINEEDNEDINIKIYEYEDVILDNIYENISVYDNNEEIIDNNYSFNTYEQIKVNASHNDGIKDRTKWKAPLTDEEFEQCEGNELQIILDNWFEKKRKILSNIKDEYERALEIVRIVGEEFDYDYRYQGSADMVLHGGGDCWASTNLIGSLCSRNGLEAYGRTAVNDGGAGSGHRNIVIKIKDKYYIGEAGYGGSKPRYYSMYESPYGL